MVLMTHKGSRKTRTHTPSFMWKSGTYEELQSENKSHFLSDPLLPFGTHNIHLVKSHEKNQLQVFRKRRAHVSGHIENSNRGTNTRPVLIKTDTRRLFAFTLHWFALHLSMFLLSPPFRICRVNSRWMKQDFPPIFNKIQSNDHRISDLKFTRVSKFWTHDERKQVMCHHSLHLQEETLD